MSIFGITNYRDSSENFNLYISQIPESIRYFGMYKLRDARNPMQITNKK